MKVEMILRRKGSDVISLRPEDTIQTAAAILTVNKIGALPVRNAEDDLVGILSERDIVKGMHANGADCINNRVRDLMTEKVITCEMDDEVVSVQDKMHNGRFRHIPVIQEGKLMGVISQGDVMHMCIEKAQTEASVMRELAIARG
ncbi:MAG: CBS domain-containing protein [Magnetovibrio sp.]|nr:CBS domain-containing protein [Magnetovibrio sp.]